MSTILSLLSPCSHAFTCPLNTWEDRFAMPSTTRSQQTVRLFRASFTNAVLSCSPVFVSCRCFRTAMSSTSFARSRSSSSTPSFSSSKLQSIFFQCHAQCILVAQIQLQLLFQYGNRIRIRKQNNPPAMTKNRPRSRLTK